MSAFVKKQGAAFYVNILAAILAIIGMVALVRCSTMTQIYGLKSLPMLCLGVAAGIVLIIVAIYAPNRFGNHDYVSTLSIIATVVLYTLIVGNIIYDRILLISGLFSYDAGNAVGWSVFYVTVVALVCLAASSLCLVVGAFMKSVK